MRRVIVSIVLLMAFLRPSSAAAAELVSILPNGSPFAPTGGILSVSDDGRYVLFPGAIISDPYNPRNSIEPLYVRDRQTKTTRLITSRQNAYYSPAIISGDGSTIVAVYGGDSLGSAQYLEWFKRDGSAYPDADQANAAQASAGVVTSLYSTFSGDTITYSAGVSQQRFRSYVQTRSTITLHGLDAFISVSGDPYSTDISSDGRWVVEPNGFLIADSQGIGSDVMALVDLSTGQRTLLPGEHVGWNASPIEASISGHGEAIAYLDTASNGTFGVLVYDRISNMATRVDVSSTGVQGNGFVGTPSISLDGTKIGFISNATNLVPGVADGTWHAYVVNRLTHVIRMVSVSATGAPVASSGRMSGDGRSVVGYSSSRNVDPAYPTISGGAYIFPVANAQQ